VHDTDETHVLLIINHYGIHHNINEKEIIGYKNFSNVIPHLHMYERKDECFMLNSQLLKHRIYQISGTDTAKIIKKKNVKHHDIHILPQTGGGGALQNTKVGLVPPSLQLSTPGNCPYSVRFQVLTSVSKKMKAFWYIALRSYVEVDQRFRGA
jgi:hypothetical protein